MPKIKEQKSSSISNFLKSFCGSLRFHRRVEIYPPEVNEMYKVIFISGIYQDQSQDKKNIRRDYLSIRGDFYKAKKAYKAEILDGQTN